jgi:hypothetical protein
MRRIFAAAAAGALILGSAAAAAQTPPAFSAEPWLADLAEARAAIDTRYANLEWLLTEREFDLDALFTRARAALAGARSDGDAVAIFNRLAQRIGDGHVSFSWPRPAAAAAARPEAPAAPPAPPTVASYCRARGYSAPSNAAGLAPALAGYAAVESGDLLPAGIVPVGDTKAGILRIPVFDPHASATLCAEAVAALSIPIDRPCDEDCDDRLITEAYRRLGLAMQDRIARLRAAGATTLIVDLTGNGGGSEWAEAAARMLSARPLQSAPVGFVRGPHWERQWRQLGERLRAAAQAHPADRARLLAWAGQADAARAEAGRRCPPTGDPACPWLGRAGFASGLVGRAPSGSFDGKDWAVQIFTPAQHSYRDGAWDGPAIVLTDQETWSAAEQFAAILQDNRAALIVGARTGGSGCGHTWGGTPTRLANSGATLNLPDCARFRADGSNEVRGIIPDQLLAWRATDGAGFRARMLEAALPEALRRARALHPGGR